MNTFIIKLLTNCYESIICMIFLLSMFSYLSLCGWIIYKGIDYDNLTSNYSMLRLVIFTIIECWIIAFLGAAALLVDIRNEAQRSNLLLLQIATKKDIKPRKPRSLPTKINPDRKVN